ncbi:MAG TPA: NAD(P)/FAD-dependent oxidoreductase [Pirellulales bacterium]|jgi:phytoene dehydrogenase-like protein|nr:NAD(P)/FAD-dependent oxidoreductase [Pirellulales bacterium]
MPRDFLHDVAQRYDCIVIGSGLAGLTCANTLARAGQRVLLLEQHYKLGGMATWFRRPGGHIFDISLHGFPIGMIKSCRRYWTQEIADSIVQLKHIRFDNPMFSLTTSFDRDDFTRLLATQFGVPPEQVNLFFDTVRRMNFYDDQSTTVGQLFEQFFPGREDVIRLLMEPITYANGSTLEDPAITYGIVFSNFMSQGVYTFEGGTDRLIKLMQAELERNGVDVRIRCDVERILVDRQRRVVGVRVNGRDIKTSAVVSNANLKATVFRLVGEECFDGRFVEEARAVRLNNSSTQVYMALKPGEMIDSACGDLLFSSAAPLFRTELLLSRDITSRTFSFYYPQMRPGSDRCLVVSSTNARYEDWASLSDEEYELSKRDLIETTLSTLEKYVPNVRDRLDHAEAATPRTFEHYTRHVNGASFGTKFEGLAVSRGLPQQIAGLYHAGSVGIIMSGWLGAMNYGVIVANDVDALLTKTSSRDAVAIE